MGYTGDGIVNCTGNIKHFKKFLVLANADAKKHANDVLNPRVVLKLQKQ